MRNKAKYHEVLGDFHAKIQILRKIGFDSPEKKMLSFLRCDEKIKHSKPNEHMRVLCCYSCAHVQLILVNNRHQMYIMYTLFSSLCWIIHNNSPILSHLYSIHNNRYVDIEPVTTNLELKIVLRSKKIERRTEFK